MDDEGEKENDEEDVDENRWADMQNNISSIVSCRLSLYRSRTENHCDFSHTCVAFHTCISSFHGRFSLPVGFRGSTQNFQIARLCCRPVMKFLPEKVLLSHCSRTRKEMATWCCTSSSAHSCLAARHANHVAAQHPFLWLLLVQERNRISTCLHCLKRRMESLFEKERERNKNSSLQCLLGISYTKNLHIWQLRKSTLSIIICRYDHMIDTHISH
jgi:hypothetical protein